MCLAWANPVAKS
jgi:hypothetical protein